MHEHFVFQSYNQGYSLKTSKGMLKRSGGHVELKLNKK